MSSPFVSHSQSVVTTALSMYASEATAEEHFDLEGECIDVTTGYELSVPSTRWWSGTLDGLANIGGLVVEPIPHVCQFSPLAPSVVAPLIWGVEYELTIFHDVISFPVFNVNPSVPTIIGHVVDGVSARWRYRGFAADSGRPLDDTLLANLKWQADWYVDSVNKIETIAIAESLRHRVGDGVVEIEMSGRIVGWFDLSAIGVAARGLVQVNIQFLPPKRIAGSVVLPRISFRRNCGSLRVSADWVNERAMNVSWV